MAKSRLLIGSVHCAVQAEPPAAKAIHSFEEPLRFGVLGRSLLRPGDLVTRRSLSIMCPRRGRAFRAQGLLREGFAGHGRRVLQRLQSAVFRFPRVLDAEELFLRL